MLSPAAWPRLPLVGVALAAVAGIAADEWLAPDPWWAAAVAGMALMLAWWHPAALWPAIMAVFAAAHGWQWQENPARVWAEALASKPRAVRVGGILTSEPEPSGDGTNRWRATMRADTWDVDGTVARQTSDLIVRWQTAEVPHYGDRWDIGGVVSRPAAPRNPGEFDTPAWLGRRGIFLELHGRDPDAARLVARDQGVRIKAVALSARAWILNTLGLGLEDAPAVRSLIAGVVLGARDDASEEFRTAFRQTGTMHLFSVSGLHVGMFALILWVVLQPLRFSRRTAVFVIIPMVFFYSLVTGAAPSSLRAATMISFALGALLLDRGSSPGNSLAAAALLLLGFDTNQLFQPGFQLSFLVVAALLLLAPSLDRRLTRVFRPDPFIPQGLYGKRLRFHAWAGRGLAGTLSVSLAAWIGGLPLTAAYFHLVPLVSIPANMAAVPLAFVILALGMLAVAGGAVSGFLAAVFNAANWGAASLLLALVTWAASLPGAYITLPPAWMRPPARLVILDLGTSGAQMLLTRRAAWLFDSGRNRDFATVLEPALRAEGVNRLEAFVLTHGDAGHAGGAVDMTKLFSPTVVFDSTLRDRSPARGAFQRLLQEMDRGRRLVFPGDQREAGTGTEITFLHPMPGFPARTADDQSVVMRIQHGPFRVLLMADAGIETETALLRSNRGNLRADILVFGRPEKDVFATGEFLDAVQPRIVVLGREDPFREGTGEAALRERLAASGAEVFDQEKSGAVTVTFRDGDAEVRGFLDGRTKVLEPGATTPP